MLSFLVTAGFTALLGLPALRVAPQSLIAPSSSQIDTLYAFQGAPDGQLPIGGLTVTPNGVLLGTTSEGGEASCSSNRNPGCGIVFALTPAGSAYTEIVLHRFFGGRAGAQPEGALVPDGSGNYYGVTAEGGGPGANCTYSGREGCGTVFELSPSRSGYRASIIHRFSGKDGALPNGNLLFTKSGSLIGVTTGGGAYRFGNIFELQHSGSTFQFVDIYDFKGGIDGRFPFSGLTAGSNGVLFGATANGGSEKRECASLDGCGTIFELLPAGKTYTLQTLYAFKGGADGFSPVHDLILDASGTIFGVTNRGGSRSSMCAAMDGCGTVFALMPSGSRYQERVLYAFGGTDGLEPSSKLILKNSTLYGATGLGGTSTDCSTGCGTLFSLMPSGSNYVLTTLVDFDFFLSGAYPAGDLTEIGNSLVGTTQNGGRQCSCGTVFSFPLQ